MARARKRHVQLDLLHASGTRVRKHPAAKRRKLGRPKKPGAGSPHRERVSFKSNEPLHVVIRAVEAVRPLRRRALYHAIREATLVAARKSEVFRIVHLSIQQSHVHLLIEAEDKTALSRGMQGFQISAAKHINAAISKRLERRRRGQVFTDRYHVEVIDSRRRARHALAYVLNNWRKHREDRARPSLVDPFSTGAMFNGWKQLEGRLTMWNLPEGYLPLFVWLPRTWLLSAGWKLYGLIDGHEVPGEHQASVRTRALRAARPG
jgi:REP element-mobilizing transposase RayT